MTWYYHKYYQLVNLFTRQLVNLSSKTNIFVNIYVILIRNFVQHKKKITTFADEKTVEGTSAWNKQFKKKLYETIKQTIRA